MMIGLTTYDIYTQTTNIKCWTEIYAVCLDVWTIIMAWFIAGHSLKHHLRLSCQTTAAFCLASSAVLLIDGSVIGCSSAAILLQTNGFRRQPAFAHSNAYTPICHTSLGGLSFIFNLVSRVFFLVPCERFIDTDIGTVCCSTNNVAPYLWLKLSTIVSMIIISNWVLLSNEQSSEWTDRLSSLVRWLCKQSCC